MVKKIDEMKTPDPDSMQAVKYSASPFIHNFVSATCEDSTVQGNCVKRDQGVYSSLVMGVEEGAVIGDKIFDVIENDSAFDTNMQIYMLWTIMLKIVIVESFQRVPIFKTKQWQCAAIHSDDDRNTAQPASQPSY